MTLDQFIRLRRGDEVALKGTACKVIGIDYKSEAVRIKCGSHRLGWHLYQELVTNIVHADRKKITENCLHCKNCFFRTDEEYKRCGWDCNLYNDVDRKPCEDYKHDDWFNTAKRYWSIFKCSPRGFVRAFKRREGALEPIEK